MSEENRAVAEKIFTALARWDISAYEFLLAEDAVETRPQLDERFVGRDNIIGMYRELPQPGPAVVWTDVSGGGESFVGQGTIHYGDGWDHLVAVLTIRDGKMVEGAFYFASPLPESPAYHQKWAEKVRRVPPQPRN